MSENNEQLTVNSEESPLPSDVSPQEEISQEEKSQISSPTSIQDAPKLEASATLTHPSSLCSDATRGVRPPRGTQTQALEGAAGRAAQSGRRNDVHEYMRIRRNYV